MKGKYFTFLLITVLIASTSAFAQTIVIFKNSTSIEVDSVRYENNQCIYTKNGSEKTVPLGLIEEIYVLNQGVLYPPPHREPTEAHDTEVINDAKKTYKHNKRKKKSEDNTTSKDKEEPVEQTYLYKPPQGFFQCEIPKSWNCREIIGVHMFSPYSLDGEDLKKTMVNIIGGFGKVPNTTFSKEDKAKMLAALERRGEKVLAERVRVIDGIEAWEKFTEIQRPKPGKRHEIMLIHDGYIVSIALDASTELFESADRQFERIVASLKFL